MLEYPYEQAVADGVNVDFDVYTIRTVISASGSLIPAGEFVDFRDRLTRRVRWERADQDIAYDADELDRKVVSRDQIRTIIRTFREKLFTEIFPGRTEVPKTLIFAKDDSHADDIVQIVREEFGRGNEFAQKITYRTGAARVVTKQIGPDGDEYEEVRWVNQGLKGEELLQSFRNSYYPRIAVTVDMIATGTDIKPLEIVFFMRPVKSRTLFEQMKGRGARTISEDEFRAVTSDARTKNRFVIIDAVGLSPEEMHDTRPLERERGVSLDRLMELVSLGSKDPNIISSLASRLARLDRQLTSEDRQTLRQTAGGRDLGSIASALVQAVDPDAQVQATGKADPSEEQLRQAAARLIDEAARPIAENPALRNRILQIKKSYEQVIDTISRDAVTFAGHDGQVREKAESKVKSFEQFIRENRDEITALQVLYNRPYRQRLSYEQIRELAEAIGRPPLGLKQDELWRAYQTLDRSKVRGNGGRILADIVSLVRFALKQSDTLQPREDEVRTRFEAWLAQRESNGRRFTDEQRQWLEAIRDHIATSLSVESDDFDYAPFAQRGGLGKAYQLFGNDLQPILAELNEVLAA